MVAVDTNVIVRLLTQDDRKQAGYATSLFAKHEIWISKTILLEASWVLRSIHRFRPEHVRTALAKLLDFQMFGWRMRLARRAPSLCRITVSISPMRCTWQASRPAPGLPLSTKRLFAVAGRQEWRRRQCWTQGPCEDADSTDYNNSLGSEIFPFTADAATVSVEPK